MEKHRRENMRTLWEHLPEHTSYYKIDKHRRLASLIKAGTVHILNIHYSR